MTEHFKYEDMTDEELIDQLREGDRQVMDYICDKYKNLVRSKAKSMYILGGDSEDLIQEGMIGLFKAVRDYDCGRDASFYTFADLCISRRDVYGGAGIAAAEAHTVEYLCLPGQPWKNGRGQRSGDTDTGGASGG